MYTPDLMGIKWFSPQDLGGKNVSAILWDYMKF